MTSKWGWVSIQLHKVGASDRVQEVTAQMMRRFDELADEFLLSDEERVNVLTYVRKLHVGNALIEDSPDERWGDVVPGSYNVGDTVRVREDAYPGEHGMRHNGKRGRVIGVAQAKAIVLYDDAKNSEESFYHEPEKLQRLV